MGILSPELPRNFLESFMRSVSYIGLSMALAVLVFVTPAIGQTTTRCVSTGDVTDCTSTAPKPPLDYAKIMENAQDLVPPYQRPQIRAATERAAGSSPRACQRQAAGISA